MGMILLPGCPLLLFCHFHHSTAALVTALHLPLHPCVAPFPASCRIARKTAHHRISQVPVCVLSPALFTVRPLGTAPATRLGTLQIPREPPIDVIDNRTSTSTNPTTNTRHQRRTYLPLGHCALAYSLYAVQRSALARLCFTRPWPAPAP